AEVCKLEPWHTIGFCTALTVEILVNIQFQLVFLIPPDNSQIQMESRIVPKRERSQRIGALERGFSSPTRSLIIVVFRHTRRKGNDYAQAQTQPTATVREDPTATAGSPRGDPGRDPGRPAGDRNQ